MYNKITSCSKITEMKSLTKFLYQTKWKWENQVKKPMQSLEEEWDEAFYTEILYYIQQSDWNWMFYLIYKQCKIKDRD